MTKILQVFVTSETKLHVCITFEFIVLQFYFLNYRKITLVLQIDLTKSEVHFFPIN